MGLFRMLACGAAFAVAASSPSAAENAQWFCAPIAATGFYWENNRWGTATFKTDDLKYVIAIRTGEANYSISTIGEEHAQPCKPMAGDALRCGVIEQWYINVEKLRYLKVYPAGFWDGADSNDNTPHMEIGRCSKI